MYLLTKKVTDMSYQKIDKNNPKIRTALLEAHNNKCFYTERPLSYEDMEVDHIIPEVLEGDRKALEVLLTDLDLPADYSLHCFQNLVPTSGRINRRKSGDPFPLIETRTYINLARKKFSKFEKRLEVAETRARSSKLRQTIDLLTDEAPYYEEVLDIGEEVCIISRKHLRLQAYFPKYPQVRGSCLITFKSVMLRDCMITFAHQEILSNLLDGAQSSSAFSLRGFFVGEYQDKYFVQLGNNRFALSQEEIEELCWAVDQLEAAYVEKLAEIERALQTRSFTRSSTSSTGLRLMQTTSDVWDNLIEFSREFDVANGSTKWHTFDFNPSMLKIYGDRQNSNVLPGYHAMIRPERLDEWDAPSFRRPDNNLHLSWKPIEGLGEGALNDYSDAQLWNPKKTHDWLIEELLPYALFYFQEKKKGKGFFRKGGSLSFEEYMRSYDSSLYCRSGCARDAVCIESVESSEDCAEIIELLQSHFYPSENIYLRAEVIKNLYSYIVEMLMEDPLDDYGYIIGNMSRKSAANRNQLIEELTDYAASLSDGSHGTAVFDYALRSILEIIKHGTLNFHGKRARELAEQMRAIWRIREQREERQRFKAH